MHKEDPRETLETSDSNDFPLYHLYFYLTEGCNLTCSHCWLAPKHDPDGRHCSVLPLELFSKIIADAIPLGLKGIKLTGGEPLLHPDFLAMLDIIHRQEINLTLETNGILCTPEIAREISQLDSPFVSVSLDGANAKTHDTNRGMDGAFLKATAAISALAGYGIKTQVIMSIMQSNFDQIEAVIQLAEELGAGSVKFNIIQPTGRGEKIHASNNGLDMKNIIRLGRKVDTELNTKTALHLFFDYPAAFRSLGRIASNDGCGVCGILSILGVLPSGEYALCGIGSHVKELIFGKAGINSLADVWQKNIILNQLRSGLPHNLKGICAKCLMKHFCLGSCLAQNYYRTNSLWSPFWFCKQAEAEGLFPDSRLDLSLKNNH